MSQDCASSSRNLGLAFNPEYIGEIAQNRQSISSPSSTAVGTGYSIHHNTIIPAIRTAKHEVVLVTCFWASSATCIELADVLRELSQKALSASTRIRVQICFSSSSLIRNMLLPTPQNGQIYSPEECRTKLGLPGAAELIGLDLQAKRKFFWPFGIWHSKYVIIDRELAIFPSCNVSWERWFEVAIPVSGPIVDHLCALHTEWWSSSVFHFDGLRNPSANGNLLHATLLSSPHTRALLPRWLQPRSLVSLLPCIRAAPAAFPPSPLLTTTHHLLSTAQRSITILTPNITEPNVVALLTSALERGVDLFLFTNRTLMTLEQIVTAGTTTPRCMKALKRRRSRMTESTRGHLEVLFFDDLAATKLSGTRAQRQADAEAAKETTPIKLHAKVTVVDGERLLFGSGNMDAASWQTSQELGVLAEGKEVVEEFMGIWERTLGRLREDSMV